MNVLAKKSNDETEDHEVVQILLMKKCEVNFRSFLYSHIIDEHHNFYDRIGVATSVLTLFDIF